MKAIDVPRLVFERYAQQPVPAEHSDRPVVAKVPLDWRGEVFLQFSQKLDPVISTSQVAMWDNPQCMGNRIVEISGITVADEELLSVYVLSDISPVLLSLPDEVVGFAMRMLSTAREMIASAEGPVQKGT